MYEEVKTYIAAYAAADTALRAAQEARRAISHSAGFGGVDCPACMSQEAYAAEIKPLRDAFRTAWDALKASSDPLVRWIAENCYGYKDSALVILEALPASMAVLNAIAEDKGWCYEWDDLRARADAAGVLPQDAEVSA